MGATLTVTSDSGRVTNDSTPTIYGVLRNPGGSVNGVTVTVYKNGSSLGTTTTASDGTWTYTVGSALGDGDVLTAFAAVALPAAGSVTYETAPTLNALTLSATTFTPGQAAGSVLASILGKTAASTIAIAAADTSGVFAVSGDGSQLLAGLNYPDTPEDSYLAQLVETLAGATNSPNETDIPVNISSATKITIPKDALVATIGDSISAPSGTAEGQSLAGWLSVASGSLFNYFPMVLNVAGASTPLGTLGVSGSRINSGTNPATTQMAYLITNYPSVKYVVIHTGTNDLVQGSETAESMLADMDTLIAQGRAAGLTMFIDCILPRGITALYTQDMEDNKRIPYNAGLLSRAADDVVIIQHDDYYQVEWNYGTDNLHPAPYGASRIGQRQAETILSQFEFEEPDPYALFASNFLTNPTFAGTGGSATSGNNMATGSVAPNSWTATNATGATVLSSVITDGDGRRGVQLDISGSATSSTGVARLYQLVTASMTAGVNYCDGMIEAHITGADGTGDFVGLKGFQLFIGDSYVFTGTEDTVAYGPMPNPDGLLRAIPKLETTNSTSQTFSFQMTCNVGAVAGRITLWEPVGMVKSIS